MTDEVGELVVANNYMQTGALSLAEYRARTHLAEYQRLIVDLEGRGKLDRTLEFLPSDEVLAEARAKEQGLTRAELSVLISYSKIDLKATAGLFGAGRRIPRPGHAGRLPAAPDEQFPEAMARHRLKREIVANQIRQRPDQPHGITFVQRLCESTGMSAADFARAYV